MSESCEYRTVATCIKQLEVAFRSIDRDLVHFLHQEGFITQAVHDEVLNPTSMWTIYHKTGQLVTGIRNKVELRVESYRTLLKYLRERGKHYEGIVNILDEAYKQEEHLPGKQNSSL